jgi:glycosyltransferase involved in cell wall biosynthesis
MSNGPQHGQANSEPLITAIIPTYQRPRLLKRAIHSVLNQTYPNLQVCIYDNASGDETEAVVREIAEKDQRVKYFCHPTNIGAARNFEYGLSHVNTPYFSLLSDDDVLLPDFYTKSLQAFEKHPDAGFVIGVTLQMEEGGKILTARALDLVPGYYHVPDGLLPMLRAGNQFWTGMLFRYDLIKDIGGFDLNVAAFDYDLELRASAACSYVVFHEPVAIFLSHQFSGSRFLPYDLVWPGWQLTTVKLSQDSLLSPQLRREAVRLLTKKMKRMLFSIGLEDVARELYDEAESVATIIRKHLGMRLQGRFLLILARLSKLVKPIRRLVTFSYHVRKRLRRTQLHYLQPKFGAYAKYLCMPDE